LHDRSGAIKIPGEKTFLEKVSAKMFPREPIAQLREDGAAPAAKRDAGLSARQCGILSEVGSRAPAKVLSANLVDLAECDCD